MKVLQMRMKQGYTCTLVFICTCINTLATYSTTRQLCTRVSVTHLITGLFVIACVQFYTAVPMLYTGLLQEVPELYLESSGSSSYHFLHKTVQEFMAALHVSSLPPGERAEFIMTSFGKSNMTMVVRFMAGLTKFQSQGDIEGVLAFQKEGRRGLLESLHWLFEAHDPGLVQKCMGLREWTLELHGEHLDPFDCYVLGYYIANSRQPWNLLLSFCSINGQCVKMLMMVEKGRAFDYIQTIDLSHNHKLGNEGAIVLGLF